MNIDENIDKFETDNTTICQEIILLGKDGSVKRIRLEEENDKNYFG